MNGARGGSISTFAAVAAAAAVGALGTLALGAITGMPAADLADFAMLLLPAALLTALCVALARPLLVRATLLTRLIAVATVGALISLANLAVMARLMFVSHHDLVVVGLLLVYASAVAVGAAMTLARSSARAVDRMVRVAGSLADGHLGARVGEVHDAGVELRELARAIDEMSGSLQRASDREREVEMRRRDLVTAVSHDLRTPIAGLRAMVEAIDDGVVEDPATIRRYAAEMRRSVGLLVVLVDDLFELAQLDAGAIEAETARATLSEVVGSALLACESQAVQKGLVIEARLDGDGDVPCSPRLSRVLQNLLSNAIRHTPADGTVRVLAERSRGELEVAVEDTGEGIDPALLDRVFDPFWRGDPSRSGGGAGLGLALAKRIVEALGGRIEARSGPGPGSRFAVRVPIPSGPVLAP